jgi:hypothetical protein
MAGQKASAEIARGYPKELLALPTHENAPANHRDVEIV